MAEHARSRRLVVRWVVLIAGISMLAVVLALSVIRMPAFGSQRGWMSDHIIRTAPTQRHTLNIVTAVTFDYRSFDTIGEEFILFASVLGATVLLRTHAWEQDDDTSSRPADTREQSANSEIVPAPRGALWVAAFMSLPMVAVAGVWVIVHGPDTPGGGFQGGILVAAAVLLCYFGSGQRTFREAIPISAIDVVKSAASACMVAAGLTALTSGGIYLQNTFAHGHSGTVVAGGMIALLNVLVGLSVAGGLVVIVTAFAQMLFVLQKAGKS